MQVYSFYFDIMYANGDLIHIDVNCEIPYSQS